MSRLQNYLAHDRSDPWRKRINGLSMEATTKGELNEAGSIALHWSGIDK